MAEPQESPAEPREPDGGEDFTTKMLRRLKRGTEGARRYTQEGEIASGGMGAILRVWDEDLRRHLAMKVVRESDGATAGTSEAGRRLLGRFLEEAQVAGQLDHPGIVPVHELGLDAQGRAYFTMKLVHGRDLDAIFELVRDGREGWTQIKALRVLLKVCEAMSYAHDKGVVHRDLKPANVMVGAYGEAYVMDWGLAKVLGRPEVRGETARRSGEEVRIRTDRADDAGGGSSAAFLTMHGDVMGTPPYMSPEQAQGDLDAMGPPSDVYAVGAMLYHLLVGHAPYRPQGELADNVETWKRLIAGPPPPSSSEAPDVSPELVAICERAMAREPGARYRNMGELAADLEAYVEGRVVSAYEAGTWAETKKWVRRNKPLAASLAALVLALAVGLGTSLVYKARSDRRGEELAQALETAKANAQLADARRADAELLATFQARMLADLAPDELGRAIELEQSRELARALEALGRDSAQIEEAQASLAGILLPANSTNVAQRLLETSVFEPAMRAIEGDYADRPLLAAMLETPLAETLQKLNLLALGERAARAAVEARRAGLGDADPDTLTSIHHLASVLHADGRLPEAESLHEEALAGRRAVLGEDHAHTVESKNDLATLRLAQGRHAEAEELLRQAINGYSVLRGEDHADTVRAIGNLATVLQAAGDRDEAESLFRRVLAARRAAPDTGRLDLCISMHNLAQLLQQRGELAEAEPLAREALALMREVLGDGHPRACSSMNNLAVLLLAKGELAEAEALFREALETQMAVLGEMHPETLSAMGNVAASLHKRGELADAEEFGRRALAGRRAALGEAHPETLISAGNLANVLVALGRLDEAAELQRGTVARFKETLGDRHPSTLKAIGNLAIVLRNRGERAESEALFREVLAGQRDVLGDDHPDTLVTISGLAILLKTQGKLDEAEPLFVEALETRRSMLGDRHPDTLQALNNIASLKYSRGDHAAAEALLRETLEGMRDVLGLEHPETLQSMNNLATLLRNGGRQSEAEPLLRGVLAGRSKSLGAEHPRTLAAGLELAGLLQARAAFAEAEALYREALATSRGARGEQDATTQRALRECIAFYDAWHAADPEGGHDRTAAELRAAAKD